MRKSTLVKLIKDQFTASRRLLNAIGDSTRQTILSTLMKSDYKGVRVGDITTQTQLSRPAVSHHLKILLDANMVRVTKKGTKNFYFFNLGEEWDTFVSLVNNIERLRIAESEHYK